MSLTSINVNNTLVTRVDSGPTAGSENLVKSDGIYQSLFLTKSALLHLDKEGKAIISDGSYGSFSGYNTYKLSNISTEQILNITVFMGGDVPNALLFDEDGTILASINTGETSTNYRTFSVDLTNYPSTSYLILNTYQYDTHNPIDLSTIKGKAFDYNHDEVIQRDIASKNDSKLITSAATYNSIYKAIGEIKLIQGTDYNIELFKENVYIYGGVFISSNYYNVLKISGSSITRGKRLLLHELNESFNGGIGVGNGIVYAVLVDGSMINILSEDGIVDDNKHFFYANLDFNIINDVDYLLVTVLKSQALQISISELLTVKENTYNYQVLPKDTVTLFRENTLILPNGSFSPNEYFDLYKFDIGSHDLYQVYTEVNYGGGTVLPVVAAYRNDDSLIGIVQSSTTAKQWYEFPTIFKGENVQYVLIVYYKDSSLGKPIVSRYINYLISRILNDTLSSFPELETKKEYYVGANRTGENTFTTLKACTEYIRNNNILNAVVHVDQGLYDLVIEYGKSNLDEYYYGNRDNLPCLHIGNNTHYIFEQGAKVKCLYDGTNSEVSTYCSAFNVYGSFTLENADVEVENMRYCVHEDLPTSVQDYSNIYSYIGTYKNCFMRHKGNPDGGYISPVCIGAGCFRQSLSIVEGGVFIADMYQHSIGWHNYHIANFGDYRSKIIVKNVYATGLYLGKYGDNLVDVEVSGCKLLNGFRYNDEHPENWFDIKEWNNITQ